MSLAPTFVPTSTLEESRRATVTRLAEPQDGGAHRTRPAHPAPKWVSTGRKVALKDGSKHSLYQNAAKPGELRIRRMATRAGTSVATYVKHPR